MYLFIPNSIHPRRMYHTSQALQLTHIHFFLIPNVLAHIMFLVQFMHHTDTFTDLDQIFYYAAHTSSIGSHL